MRTYLRLLRYLKPYRGRLAAAILCSLVYATMSALSIGMVSPFMKVLFEGRVTSPATERVVPHSGSDRAIGAPSPASVALVSNDRLLGWPQPLKAWFEGAFLDARPLVALERICVFIVVVWFLKNLADYLQAFHMAAVEQAAIRDLRSAVFAHLQRLPLSFFHVRRTGMLLSRITSDVEFLRVSLAAGISNVLKESLTLAGCLAWVFLASWRLALLSLLILPPVALGLVVIGRQMRKRSSRAQERMADVTSVLHESVTGARVVRAFGRERFESEKFDRANDAFYRAFVRLRWAAAAARPLTDYAIVLVAAVMLWFGGREILVTKTLPPEQFFLFATALLAMISPLKTLSEVSAHVQQGVAAADRIFSILDTPLTIQDRPGARALPRFRDAVRYERVAFAYKPGTPVLSEISFEIRRGEVVALVGSSGAGKSTVMDLLARFYDPTAGRIAIDGVDLRDATLESLRAQFGIVTQETILFHDTVRNNIAYGRPEASDDEVREAAQAAHAHDFIEKLPQGYDSVIGERGAKLSGGERQRLAIARALLRNPPILLLDEATSSLDTESERLVQEALERLMRGRTVLVIAHRLSTVQHADRIVVLEGGKVAANGTHAELLDQGGLYRRLYDLQFVA